MVTESLAASTKPPGSPSSADSCCSAFYEQDWVRQLAADSFHPGGEELTRRAIAAMNLPHGAALADLGCGTGTSALMLAREGNLRISAVDLSASSTGEPYFQVDCECEATSGNLLLQAPTTSKVLTIANYGTASLSVSNVTFSNPSNACGTLTMSGWSGSKTVSAGDTFDLTFTYTESSTATTFCSVKDEVFIETNAGTATKTIKGQFLF